MTNCLNYDNSRSCEFSAWAKLEFGYFQVQCHVMWCRGKQTAQRGKRKSTKSKEKIDLFNLGEQITNLSIKSGLNVKFNES